MGGSEDRPPGQLSLPDRARTPICLGLHSFSSSVADQPHEELRAIAGACQRLAERTNLAAARLVAEERQPRRDDPAPT